jgi:hypothetical protein
VKTWFRPEKKKAPQEDVGDEDVTRVHVVVYLEDPGSHTHRSSGYHQLDFDTTRRRPKFIFWRKLVRVFKLKGLYWEWQRKITDGGAKTY